MYYDFQKWSKTKFIQLNLKVKGARFHFNNIVITIKLKINIIDSPSPLNAKVFKSLQQSEIEKKLPKSHIITIH